MICGLPGLWSQNIETVIYEAIEELAKQTGISSLTTP
jgi:hypothetical protein